MEMPAPDPRAAERAERARGLHEASSDAADWFVTQLNGIAGAEARGILERRGVSTAIAKTFGLGFAPDSRGTIKAALKDYGDPMLVEAGLLIGVEGRSERAHVCTPVTHAPLVCRYLLEKKKHKTQ